MRLVFAGTPAPAVPSLQALLASDRHEVVAVLTRPDARSGRGRTLRPSPIKQLAEEAGIQVLQPGRPREPEFIAQLTALAPDCCPVVAYGSILPGAVLEIPARGWVNLHFSLLPAWRGAAPVQHAVLAGDEVTGATTFQLEEGMDTGPVFGVVTEEISAKDTSGDLLERLSISGAHLLTATLDGIEDGTLHAIPQPAEGISMAPKIEVDDVRVDWSAPALRVDRLIRSAAPAPGAWTTYAGQRVKLGPVEVWREGEQLRAGEILATSKSVQIGTATYPVRLSEVKPEGKGWMPATAWANGLRLVGGERIAGEQA